MSFLLRSYNAVKSFRIKICFFVMVFLLVCVVKVCCSVIDLKYSYLGKTGNK